MKKTDEQRFWNKTNKNGPLVLESPCWIWVASKNSDGYGNFRYEGKIGKAHRWSYEFHKGPILGRLLVCHKCDNPSCVNPDHLFLGTDLDNARDCINKGREKHVRGEAVNTSKLTESQVLEIRSMEHYHGSNKRLSEYLGVSVSTIEKIKGRVTWKHI